jgi:hypothetical protein
VLQRAVDLGRSGCACEWRRHHSGHRRVELSKVVQQDARFSLGGHGASAVSPYPPPSLLLPGGSDLRR